MEQTPIITFMNIFEGLKILIEEPYEDIKYLIDEKTINKYLKKNIKKNKFPPNTEIRFIIIMRPNNPYYINKENKIFEYKKDCSRSRNKYPYGDIIIVFKNE